MPLAEDNDSPLLSILPGRQSIAWEPKPSCGLIPQGTLLYDWSKGKESIPGSSSSAGLANALQAQAVDQSLMNKEVNAHSTSSGSQPS